MCASTAYMICSNLIHLLYLYATLHGAMTILLRDVFNNPRDFRFATQYFKDKLPKTIEYSVVDYGGYLGCLGIVSEILTE